MKRTLTPPLLGAGQELRGGERLEELGTELGAEG